MRSSDASLDGLSGADGFVDGENWIHDNFKADARLLVWRPGRPTDGGRPMVTAKKTTELLMRCPECGAECGMTITTDDMSTVECRDCNGTFTPSEAAESWKAASEKWERFAEWLRSAASV